MTSDDRPEPPASRPTPAPGSIGAQRERRPVETGPTHPKLAATLLMVGIVVLLAAIAAAPLLGR
ncbi:MAG: hypothetical protein M3Y51_01550 [Actinomycetota bacterium]|nr:hypothetical protein [Actinomycetota bacterium]